MRAILFLLLASILLGSCKKSDDPGLPFGEQLSLDSAAIADFLAENNITDAISDKTGYIKYVLHEETNGVIPQISDSVEVTYAGRLMDTGEEFDAGEHVEFKVNGLITGWQLVLTEIHEGDSVTMYIPSGYAYGTKGSGDKIPANANLIFDMRLHRVFQ